MPKAILAPFKKFSTEGTTVGRVDRRMGLDRLHPLDPASRLVDVAGGQYRRGVGKNFDAVLFVFFQ